LTDLVYETPLSAHTLAHLRAKPQISDPQPREHPKRFPSQLLRRFRLWRPRRYREACVGPGRGVTGSRWPDRDSRVRIGLPRRS